MSAFGEIDYYLLDNLMTPEERMLRPSVRDFLNKEIKPNIPDAFHVRTTS